MSDDTLAYLYINVVIIKDSPTFMRILTEVLVTYIHFTQAKKIDKTFIPCYYTYFYTYNYILPYFILQGSRGH